MSEAEATPYQDKALRLRGGQGTSILGSPTPTLRENIEAKIQYYKDEIERLERVKTKMEFMLDVNLRDLREAMNI